MTARALLLAAALALGAPAAATVASAQDFSRVEIRTEQLAPGLHVIFGAGGNIGVSSGPDGVFLVDDQFAPLTPRIVEAVRAISDQPIRFVLNTHWHGDHTGGNENLGRMGAVIVAHDNVRTRMSTDQFNAFFNRSVPASPQGALPVVTFSETATFHLNGDEIRVVHVPAAHTDGDALVWFLKGDAVHMGDTFFEGYPYIDLSSGGTARGLVRALDTALGLGGPQTRFIRGHGPVASRAELVAYRDMIRTVIARVEPLVRRGRSLEEVRAAKPTAEFDSAYDGGFIKADAFVQFIYESLKAEAPAKRR